MPSSGLSPHVRGNLIPIIPGQISKRSIPARAGEPSGIGRRRAPRRVYPRTCGGTRYLALPDLAMEGLSPHVRGNHVAVRRAADERRSIPARAGEPLRLKAFSISARVYPRTCGGTSTERMSRLFLTGLSPHVRGNRSCRPPGRVDIGSIPARAGEPRRPDGRSPLDGVYPRTCGGTLGLLFFP